MINFYNQQNRNHNHKPNDGSVNNQIPAGKNGAKSNFKKYIDPTDEFSAKQLKWAMWYVNNKLLLYRLAVGSLIVFIAATFAFSLWRGAFILYYDFFQQPRVDVELSRAPNYDAINQRNTPQPLQIMGIQVLPGGTDKNDAIVEIANPNERHIVFFDYYFDFSGQKTEPQSGFLLPLEARPMVAMGLDTSWAVGTANIIIENISWRRVSAHLITDIRSWQNERLNFSVSDFVFKLAGSRNGASAHIINFKLTNNSPYSYKNPEFYLGLYQNNSMVGIMKLFLDDFISLQARDIDLRSFVSNLAVTEIKIFPIINLYEKAVYLSPSR